MSGSCRTTIFICVIRTVILCSPSPSPGNFAYFAPNLKQTHQIEQHLPGMASSAVIDELKDYILALNSFVIEAERKSWRKGSGSISFYDKDGKSDSHIMDDSSAGSCSEINEHFQSHTKTIEVQNTCVRIYSGSKCRGKNRMFSPVTTNMSGQDIVGTFGRIRSFSSCDQWNFSESSNITLKGEVTVDCRRNEATKPQISISS